MWFDRQGLEQATTEAVARHKSRRFCGPVWDYCSGIGGDLIAMAEHCDVTGVDLSQAACLRAQWNADVYGVAPRVHLICADVATPIVRVARLSIADRKDVPRAARAGSRNRFISPNFSCRREFPDESLSPPQPAESSPTRRSNQSLSECKEATVWFMSWRLRFVPRSLGGARR
jgi:hypothetical protein